MSVMMIDRGTSSGVERNMPVVTPDGIVGYVAEAGLSWAKVVTVCEAASSVGAVVERTGETGLVSGSYTLAADNLLKMTYLSPDSDIAVGDRIVTSGYGNVYPRGLIIGYVESVENDSLSQTVTATVKLAARLADPEKVMVITAYEAAKE
jgi:rod shape-determining protein MreC